MREKIEEKLAQIEELENVRILYAAESGSRAWGFASPDSDYDVRFVYMRDIAHYLKLEKTRDVIEWIGEDGILDVSGWDLQKTLRLLHVSNPTLFEWINSPIVYRTSQAWSAIREGMDSYFLVRAAVLHYLGMTNDSLGYLKGETYRLKKCLYAIRTILACKWVVQRRSPPPVAFAELLDSQLEPGMRGIVDGLLELKTASVETDEVERNERLVEYLKGEYEHMSALANTISPSEKPGYEGLDRMFLEAIGYGK